jgi:hypothetical protein
LERNISENMKGVRTLVYNSSRPGTSLEDVQLGSTMTSWYTAKRVVQGKCPLQMHHFDSLVAYWSTSQYTPSVDLSPQQLFRVRSTKGEMHIHVHNKRPNVKLPHTVTGHRATRAEHHYGSLIISHVLRSSNADRSGN